MIIDALLAAEKHLKIAERIKDPRKFLHLTDAILLRIEESVDEPVGPKRLFIFSEVLTAAIGPRNISLHHQANQEATVVYLRRP